MVDVGRPRTFNLEDVLEKALTVFWRKGYKGASMTDLIEGMGINRSSIYAAFHSKEELFRQALDLYLDRSEAFMDDALSATTIRGCAERILIGAVEKYLCPQNPKGCLAVQCLVTISDVSDPMRVILLEHCKMKENRVVARFDALQREGGHEPFHDSRSLSKFIGVVIRGMAVQIAAGATTEDLYGIVAVALNAFPHHREMAAS